LHNPMKDQLKKPASNAAKIGPDYFKVRDLLHAQNTWNAARDPNGWGASDSRQCTACVDRKLCRISYNGGVWDAATREEVLP
jgi:hypothetical protein